MDLDFEIQCPKCKRKVKLKMRNLKKGSSHPCPRCKTEFVVSDDNFRKAQKELDDFQKNLKKLKF